MKMCLRGISRDSWRAGVTHTSFILLRHEEFRYRWLTENGQPRFATSANRRQNRRKADLRRKAVIELGSVEYPPPRSVNELTL